MREYTKLEKVIISEIQHIVGDNWTVFLWLDSRWNAMSIDICNDDSRHRIGISLQKFDSVDGEYKRVRQFEFSSISSCGSFHLDGGAVHDYYLTVSKLLSSPSIKTIEKHCMQLPIDD